MSGLTMDVPGNDERVAIISGLLSDAFGGHVCLVVERQIEATADDRTRIIWLEIWDRLCAPQARRA